MHVKRHFAKLIFVFGLVYALYILGRNYGSTKPTIQFSHWKSKKTMLDSDLALVLLTFEHGIFF